MSAISDTHSHIFYTRVVWKIKVDDANVPNVDQWSVGLAVWLFCLCE